MDSQHRPYQLVRKPAPAAPPPELDAAQRLVVSHSGGPLLVLAGPGTGKTTAIVEAVHDRIVRRGMRPERVLVLTFSRQAAADLRERITLRLNRTTTEPLALTFHSYAYALVRREFAVSGDQPPVLLSGPEQLQEVRRMLRGEAADGALRWPSRLQPLLGTRGFAAELRDFLLRAAERGFDGPALASLGRQRGRDDWEAAGRFLSRYAARFDLAPVPAYDYAEIIRLAGQLLSGPAVRQRERQAYDAVLVDEFQDTDPAQEQMLHALAGDGRELVVVGDPDQSIYAFRGADSDAISRFPGSFLAADGSPAKVIALRTARRGGPVLLAGSRRVAARLPAVRGVANPLAQKWHRELMPPSSAGPGEIRIVVASSPSQEAALIADALRRAHLIDGLPWSSMAVLVRSATRQLPVLARAMAGAGVPVARAADELPLALHPGTRPLLQLLSCALRPGCLTEEAAADLLTGPFGGTDTLGLRRLRRLLTADSGSGVAAGVPTPDVPSPPVPVTDVPVPDVPVPDVPVTEVPVLDGASSVRDVPAPDRAPAGSWDTPAAAPAPGSGPLAAALADPRMLTAAGWPAGDVDAAGRALAAARKVAGLLRLAAEVAATGTAHEVLWAVWSASGLAADWQASSAAGGPRGSAADADLDAVLALFDAAARFDDRMPAGAVALFHDGIGGQEISGHSLARHAVRDDAVVILTAHRAKGLEWDLVAVAGVQEGTWPDLRQRGSLLSVDELVDVAAGRPATGGSAAAGAAVTGADAAAAALSSRLLDDERRLFYVAVTRASRTLVVTAVGGADSEQRPSRFLAELAAEDIQIEQVTGASRRWLSLPALVAELRRAVADRQLPAGVREAAAAELATLAAAGVSGASPGDWHALTQWSGTGLITDGDVRISPSQVEKFVTCGLRWLLESGVGAVRPSTAGHFGTVIHAAAALVAEGADADLVAKRIDEIWHQLDFGSVWYSAKQRELADDMVAKFLDWHQQNPRELVAVEQRLIARIGQAVITGRVDRLERAADGSAVVVDLKTVTSPVAQRDLARHPQLGVYQLAVLLGAFAGLGLADPGGAELVQLGRASFTHKARVQPQPPLRDDPEPDWARALVADVAAGMAGPEFQAVVNARCRTCPVAQCCPADERGIRGAP